MDSAVTIGKFDGFHRGHKILLETLLRESNDNELESVVFKIDTAQTQILSDAEQREIMQEFHVDRFIRQLFTPEFSSIEPDDFVEDILIRKLHMKCLIVGSDFCFGNKRCGNIELLKELSDIYGFKLHVIEKIEDKKSIISSTRIREAITNGDIEEVNTLLGRQFGFQGIVEHGNHIGTTLGFPTINLMPGREKIIPKFGVYSSETILCSDDGTKKIFKSITNVGNNPTIANGLSVTIETFIYNFNSYIYGNRIRVELKKMLRGEKKFRNLEELKKQIAHDIEDAESV